MEVGKIFLDMTQKAMIIKEKRDKLDFIKILNLWSSKHIIKKIIRKPQTGRIFS